MKPISEKVKELVAEAIVKEPKKSYLQIGADFNMSEWMVARIAVKYGVRRPYGKKSPAWLLNYGKKATV